MEQVIDFSPVRRSRVNMDLSIALPNTGSIVPIVRISS